MENHDVSIETIEKMFKCMKALEKKLDLALKALNLVKVSPEEAKKIQLQQRENMATQAKVNAELDDMENKDKDKSELVFNTPQDIYGDVLGDDILGGIK
jgi:hypothetical protein